MAKFTTHKEDFDRINLLNKINSILFWALLVINILPELLKRFLTSPPKMDCYVTLINFLIIVSFIASFVIAIIVEYYLIPVAESKRRADYFENSFIQNFQLKNSEEYFTNEEINPGFYKMAVNLFQNLFFTISIAKLMIPKVIFKAAIGLLIFISISYIGFNNDPIFITLLQAIFSLNITGQTIKFFIYYERKKQMMQELQILFSNPESIKGDKAVPQIIKLYTDYECNISWGLISLDDKLFNKRNNALEEKWGTIKIKFKIL
jgi:hypothetical protein